MNCIMSIQALFTIVGITNLKYEDIQLAYILFNFQSEKS